MEGVQGGMEVKRWGRTSEEEIKTDLFNSIIFLTLIYIPE